MPDTDRSTSLDDAQLLPYLPMIYVAWSDGDLLPEEIAGICPQLDGHCQILLKPWLDPEAPPSTDELAQMLRLIQLQAGALDRRDMYENVFRSIAGCDESITLRGVEKLYCTGIHKIPD